jgi:hypothetical protein
MAPKKTRKRSHNSSIQPLYPKNAYDFYNTFHPITEKFKTTHPDLYTCIAKYKGMQYIPINVFLNTLEFLTNKYKLEQKLDNKPTVADQTSDKEMIEKSRFKAAYKKIKGDDMISSAIKHLLINITYIENIRKMFSLYKAPKNYKLPMLYRGIFLDEFQKDPFKDKKVGDSITINQIMSTSLTPAVALSFQTCSEKGPCCLFRINLDNNVKFIPIFYIYGESYTSSEHEVIIEPFTECKLLARTTKRIPYDIGVQCPYNKFNKDGKITVTVYDVQISKPKKESIKLYEEILEKIEKNPEDAIANVEIKLKIEPPVVT